MNLLNLINRAQPPQPWLETEKIPWNEPGFSARMLKEHLSQRHDLASRRLKKIESQVDWIHNRLLDGKTIKILDLGCGPGLYTSQLSKLGHDCTGIDFSPASIAYAAASAADQGGTTRPRCIYLLEDIRSAKFGSDYGLVMLLFGEFNVFCPGDARLILQKAQAALLPSGILLLELHTEDAIRAIGAAKPEWYSSQGGLFSCSPHLCLIENYWDEENSIATRRYIIIDAASTRVSQYATSTKGYTQDEYHCLLETSGFKDEEIFDSLSGMPDPSQAEFFVLTARK